MLESEKIHNKILELEAAGKTNTAEYNHLNNKYADVRSKELKTWTSNWKKIVRE